MKSGHHSIFIFQLGLFFTLALPTLARAQTFPIPAQTLPLTPSFLPSIDPSFSLPVPADVTAATQLDNSANPLAPVWIWSHQTKNSQTILLRKSIFIAEKLTDAALTLTADDTFTVFVNGQELDHSSLSAEGKSTWATAHRVRITEYLTPNRENTIAILAKNTTGSAGVLARLDWIDSRGTRQMVSSRSWKVLADPSPDFQRQHDWKLTEYNDERWRAATVIAPLSGDPWRNKGGLKNWPGYQNNDEFYLKHLSITPVSVKIINGTESNFVNLDSIVHPNADGSQNFQVILPFDLNAKNAPAILLDFGQELAGNLEITSSDASNTVTISPGESPIEAMQNPWPENSDKPIPLVANQILHSTNTGFRFMVIEFGSAQPPLANLTQHYSHLKADFIYYPVNYQGSFESSDPLLNKIWYTGAYTTHLCMQEDIWDSAKRDRKRWMGDLTVSGDVINNVFGDRFLMEQTFSRIRADAQRNDDETALPQKHVDNAAPYNDKGLPGYSYAWINQLASFQRHQGDTNYLLRQHDLLVSMLNYIELDLDHDGLFKNLTNGWNFVDWSPGFEGQTSPLANLETNLFLVKTLKEAAFLFTEMHDAKNAKKYEEFAEKERELVRHKLQNPQDATFGDRRQTNAMAIFAGVTTPRESESIFENILKPGNPDWKFYMTPYFLNFVNYAMSMTGHTQAAMDYLKIYYGEMLALGNGTWFELWDLRWPQKDFHEHMDVKAAGVDNSDFVSLSHGWSAGPTNWLTERVLGIRPTGSGFATVDIDPDLANLTWVKGAVPTPRGLLSVKVEHRGSSRPVFIDLPTETIAHVYVTQTTVHVDDELVWSQKDESGKLFVTVEKAGSHLIQ
jgi:alpha-L-rhamnosidase